MKRIALIIGLLIVTLGAAWVARAGYYKDGKFIADENHADTCIVDGCFVTDCDEGFRNENQQALYWKFRDLAVGGYGGKGLRPCLIFNIQRGGAVMCDGLQLCHRQATIFKVRDFNPHTNWLVCRDVLWDAYAPDNKNWLTLFEGPDNPGVTGKWSVRINGQIANPDPNGYDSSKLIVAQSSLPLHDIRIDVENMPTKNFHPVDGAMAPNEQGQDR